MSVSDELVQANAEDAKRFDRAHRKVEQVDLEPAAQRRGP
jgi:hypothetical protein